MYPSVKTLCQIKDVTPALAREIRRIMAGPGREHVEDHCSCRERYDSRCLSRMERIDRVLGTSGVEAIPAGHNAQSPTIVYCNAGDTYATTILKVSGKFRVGCWGDLVERGRYE